MRLNAPGVCSNCSPTRRERQDLVGPVGPGAQKKTDRGTPNCRPFSSVTAAGLLIFYCIAPVVANPTRLKAQRGPHEVSEFPTPQRRCECPRSPAVMCATRFGCGAWANRAKIVRAVVRLVHSSNRVARVRQKVRPKPASALASVRRVSPNPPPTGSPRPGFATARSRLRPITPPDARSRPRPGFYLIYPCELFRVAFGTAPASWSHRPAPGAGGFVSAPQLHTPPVPDFTQRPVRTRPEPRRP
jgi:hypothetical protein